jgi:iron complex transport system ATP-binding protein
MSERRSFSAEALSVGWTEKTVAQNIDLTVSSGEILVIAGPNGAGKSTILKTLVNQIAPLAGTIKLNGADTSAITPRQFASEIAYVPQSLELGQDLTVEELVSLGRNPHQQWWSWRASAEDRRQVEDALKKTETEALKDRYISRLSGGEKQRAMIAMALAQQPVFMMLDEPTAHLDFRHQLELIDLLLNLAQQNIGIIVVLHDLNLIARLADRVLLLEKLDGSPSVIAASGATTDVLTAENLRRVYKVHVSIIPNSPGSPLYVPTSL